MPAKSKAQLRWVNSKEGHKALGEKGVKEWNKSTSKSLPERLGKPKSVQLTEKLGSAMKKLK